MQVAAELLGAQGNRTASLHINPRSGRLYYEVETARFATRWVLWVDAVTGDRFQLQSADGRQKTYDAGNMTASPGTMMTDDNDVWDTELPLSPSPAQPPGVDAHYYANVVDDFYGDTYSRDSIDNEGMPIISTVHYDAGYCNAFWNGTQMTYGDGDGVACLPLSGGLDVVGHELTHGVTEFTSGLIYENESDQGFTVDAVEPC